MSMIRCDNCDSAIHAKSSRCVECGALRTQKSQLAAHLSPRGRPDSVGPAPEHHAPPPPPPRAQKSPPMSPRAEIPVSPRLKRSPLPARPPAAKQAAPVPPRITKPPTWTYDREERALPPSPRAESPAVPNRASKPVISGGAEVRGSSQPPPEVIRSKPPPPPLLKAPPPTPDPNSRRRAASAASNLPAVGAVGPPPIPDATGRRVSSKGGPPPVPDAHRRQKSSSIAAVSDSCRAVLVDSTRRSMLQEFATELGPCQGSMVVFLALVDEFRDAHSTHVRVALGARIYQDFVKDSSPNQLELVIGADSLRARLARDYVKNIAASFYDALEQLVLVYFNGHVFQPWVQQESMQPRRSPRTRRVEKSRTMQHEISAPTLSLSGDSKDPSAKYTLIPIAEAQSAAGVRSQTSLAPGGRSAHRRSLSVGSATTNAASTAYAIKVQRGGGSGSIKGAVTPPSAKSASPRGSPRVERKEHHHKAVGSLVGDDRWLIESVLSDQCQFRWEFLNAENTDPKIKAVKCMVIGDMGVGKTQLCKCMLGDEFDGNSEPTVFETYKVKVPIFKEVNVEFWDMSGNSKYDRKRPVVYPNVNCLLVCFDVTCIASWNNLQKKWIPEIQAYAHLPVFIVGLKYDAIDASNASRCVQPSVVQKYIDMKLFGNFKCVKYFSCSAAKCGGLEDIFQAIVYATLYETSKADEVNSTVSKLRELRHVKLK